MNSKRMLIRREYKDIRENENLCNILFNILFYLICIIFNNNLFLFSLFPDYGSLINQGITKIIRYPNRILNK